MSNELNSAPIQELGDGGFIVAITDEGTPEARRLPVADVAAGVALAATALQPEGVGGAAYEDAEAYVRVEAYETALAEQNDLIEALQETIDAQAALIEGLQAQIDALAALIGDVGTTLFDPDDNEDLFDPEDDMDLEDA